MGDYDVKHLIRHPTECQLICNTIKLRPVHTRDMQICGRFYWLKQFIMMGNFIDFQPQNLDDDEEPLTPNQESKYSVHHYEKFTDICLWTEK